MVFTEDDRAVVGEGAAVGREIGAELVKLARLGVSVEECDVVMHVVLGGACLLDTVAERFVLQILHFQQVVFLTQAMRFFHGECEADDHAVDKERAEVEDILSSMYREYREKKYSWDTVVDSYFNILITISQ